MELEDAVARLQKDLAEYRYGGVRGPANPSQTTRWWGFTSTPVPRYSGKSSWEQYRQVFQAIVCSNGWDDVTAVLQLLSHLDGDALNVALLVPESQRVLSGVLMSEHYDSPGRLAEYKRQFRRAFRRPGNDPSVFAIELETLARRAFADIDSIQLQMVRDRFIARQAECALCRHLDSMGPDTPMRDIVDSCHVWESHTEAMNSWNGGPDPKSPRAIYQVAEDTQSPVVSKESETLDEIIGQLLPTPAVSPPKATPIPSDCELLIQRLLGAVRPAQPVIQERSRLTDIEIMLQSMLLVGSVKEVDVPPPAPRPESLEGCFSCVELTHETEQCLVLDESFPFMPLGWRADRIDDEFILRPGPTGPPCQQAGNVD